MHRTRATIETTPIPTLKPAIKPTADRDGVGSSVFVDEGEAIAAVLVKIEEVAIVTHIAVLVANNDLLINIVAVASDMNEVVVCCGINMSLQPSLDWQGSVEQQP